MLSEHFIPVEIVTVVRRNVKLEKNNWHAAALEQNFFLRGFNYLFIMGKPETGSPGIRDRRLPEEWNRVVNEAEWKTGPD